ncbi:MAG: amino acid ABC transporter permease [Chloroflexi bacterium]|nr:MAG: amino acid ABC transporter permease [Chloroflexota bacterium]
MNFDGKVFLEALTSKSLIQGVQLTIALTVVSFVVGLLIGLLMALMRDSRVPLLRWLSWTYVWIFRGIPTLIQLFIVWFALPQVFPALREPWFTPFLAATIALAFNEAAYAAEILRGGLLAVDEGQRLAARALGMPPFKVFSKVVAPQLTRVTIPPMANDFITLLKITSLASVTSLRELMTNTQAAVSSSFRFAEWYGAAAIYYLVLVSIFMVGQSWLERRYVWTSQARGPRSLMRAIGR